MKHEFIYNGMNSDDFGLTVSGEDTWKRPQPDITRISVPGRNGDLIQLGNRFLNVDITYHCGIVKHLKKNFDAFNAALLSDIGYHRLEDTYHPEYYRMGVFESALDPDVKERAVHGEVDITFNCKPQMFLKSGEIETGFNITDKIYNPTPYTAYPLVRFSVVGPATVGTIRIGENYITFAGVGEGNTDNTIIDCETQDIYGRDNKDNRNSAFALRSGSLFELAPGWNNIIYSGLSGKLYITPRWWTV